jgi:tRNA(Phe) wybutosine-synthesizing methylase Tyw3
MKNTQQRVEAFFNMLGIMNTVILHYNQKTYLSTKKFKDICLTFGIKDSSKYLNSFAHVGLIKKHPSERSMKLSLPYSLEDLIDKVKQAYVHKYSKTKLRNDASRHKKLVEIEIAKFNSLKKIN